MYHAEYIQKKMMCNFKIAKIEEIANHKIVSCQLLYYANRLKSTMLM